LDGDGRVALLLGAEGDGLSPGALAAAGRRVRIPMRAGVDSLNVATAAAIVFQRLDRLDPLNRVDRLSGR
jgi:tRNA G18 (ribose-2'-O)-methylase SpoU